MMDDIEKVLTVIEKIVLIAVAIKTLFKK